MCAGFFASGATVPPKNFCFTSLPAKWCYHAASNAEFIAIDEYEADLADPAAHCCDALKIRSLRLNGGVEV
jgi:hypothetical protein